MNERRLVVVTNKNSTGAKNVERSVLTPLREENISFDQFETPSPDTEANIIAMQDFFRDGDRIISAAGDGTAMQVTNAVLRSKLHDAEIGFLPFGNFNDLAKSHKARDPVALSRSSFTVEHAPLSVNVNGEYWRDAPSYVTLGWTALAAEQFGNGTSREAMQSSPEALKLGRSLLQLAESYFKNRHEMLPEFYTSDSPIVRRAVTDFIAINSPRVGNIVRSSKNYYDSDHFGTAEVDVSRILTNIPFGLRAISGRTPATPVGATTLYFEKPATVPIQSEGEFSFLEDVRTIEIGKDPRKVLHVLRQP